MHKKSAAIAVSLLFAGAVLASDNAVAKPVRTTTISTESAEAFCHDHGGGTNCVFCHWGHCHVISCSQGSGGQTFCTNTVTFRAANRIGARPPAAGIKSFGGNAPPQGHRSPVKISGFNPPSGIKTLGGSGQTVPIERAESHHSGGHR